jgi:hypothetical protein
MLQNNASLAPKLDSYRHVGRWLERLRGFGHGEAKPMASLEALDLARSSQPRPRPGATASHGDLPLGADVEIAADDYAFEPSAGRLVHCGPDELAIERTDARAGRVVVHFPRIGYRVKALA